MIKRFIDEEKGKASLEHMVYAAGIAISLIFIFMIYSSYLDAVNSCVDHPMCP